MSMKVPPTKRYIAREQKQNRKERGTLNMGMLTTKTQPTPAMRAWMTERKAAVHIAQWVSREREREESKQASRVKNADRR